MGRLLGHADNDVLDVLDTETADVIVRHVFELLQADHQRGLANSVPLVL